MESENMDSSTNMVKCCECGSSYCDPINRSYSGTWLRSVKRKLDEFEENDDKFFIPGFIIPSIAHVEIENECDALREMVSNQQRTIQDLISDLEEERYASSSATNEAMSMILKLQSEKAEIQMEARQFKRFSEEKTAHDQQELMVLEELLYQREQSIQSLTCEAQAYKHRMISLGFMGSDCENNVQINLESRFDFASYDYPHLKCDNLNENQMYPENDNETVDIEEIINQLEKSPTQSQPVLEKVIAGQSPMKRRFSTDSFATVKEELAPDSSRVLHDLPSFKKVETESEFGDGMSDRIYTIDSIHKLNNDLNANVGSYDDYLMSSPKESLISGNEIEDLEVKKLYARLHALEADRESMRQTLISMRTDKAQFVLLKEIAQHLCKEITPQNTMVVKKSSVGVQSSLFSVFKWIVSFGYWGRRAQRNQHIFAALACNAGLLMVLNKGPQMGQWRCLSSTQV